MLNGFTEDARNLPLRAVQFSLVTTTAYSAVIEEELDGLRKAVELVDNVHFPNSFFNSGMLIHLINIIKSCRSSFKTQYLTYDCLKAC